MYHRQIYIISYQVIEMEEGNIESIGEKGWNSIRYGSRTLKKLKEDCQIQLIINELWL